MEHMQTWKQPPKRPSSFRRTSDAAVQVMIKFAQVWIKFAELHDCMTKPEDMSKSIQLCFDKSIRAGGIL